MPWPPAHATEGAAPTGTTRAVVALFALAITCDDRPEIIWTVDNPALLLMSEVSELVAQGLLPTAR